MPPLIDVAEPAEQFGLLESLLETTHTETTPVTRWVNATNELVKTIILKASELRIGKGSGERAPSHLLVGTVQINER